MINIEKKKKIKKKKQTDEEITNLLRVDRLVRSNMNKIATESLHAIGI